MTISERGTAPAPISPALVVDALDAATRPDEPPAWFEILVDEQSHAIALIRHDGLGDLFGWQADAGSWGVGAVAGGRVRSLDGPDGPTGPGLDTAAPMGRARTVIAFDRAGSCLARTELTASGRIETGEPEGRLPDALRRTIGLPTAPPVGGSAPLIARLWLSAAAAAIEEGDRPLRWSRLVELHPAVGAVLAMGEPLEGAEVDALIAMAPRFWTWDRLREETAAGGGMATLVAPSVAAWMDDGMFARWTIDQGPDLRSLWGVVAAGLDTDAALRLASALDDADDPRLSSVLDGYHRPHA